jgi:hypothetical protein
MATQGGTRGHPSRRGQEAAPQDEVGDIFLRRIKLICPSGKSATARVFACPAPFAKIFLFFRSQITSMFSPSRSAEGRWPSSRTLGRDAVDAAAPARLRRSQGGISVSDSRARRRTVLLRTVKSCGPDASKVGVKLVEVLRTRPGGQSLNPPMTVPKKPDRRGEHEISRKTIACGNAGRSRCDRGDYSCAFYPCTRGCGCIGHPAFPTPSFGRRINAQPGRIAPRECGVASPFAIHSFLAAPWIASLALAMTTNISCLGCLKIETLAVH